MKLIDFIADRIGYIAIYLFNILLVVAVVQLAMLPQGLSIQLDNLLYIGVLCVAGVATYLLIDYVRQRAYYKKLLAIESHPEPLDRINSFPEGVTREQEFMAKLVRQLHSGVENRLTHYRKQQEQHDVFIRQWVHQMKTPVSVIDLLTQQADEETDTRETLQSIQEENDRLAHGLDMMLQTARLEKFELDVHIHKVNLEQVVRGVINEHKRACIRKGVFPKLAVDQEARYAETDEKWIAVIFRQIVSNAIKYAKNTSGEAGKQLEITLLHKGDGVRAVFRDTGIGIPGHDMPRVFDPFFTGENGRTTGESTGMGLYLVRELCRKLGHRIDIQSAPGVGTTVTIHFPPASVLHDVLRR
ncbi:sensor histidine kinase [Paenibacillus sp. H1-7]|uniref:sensor histidine kinase n=1 Tax=Paenibacillus sp. H1-7 TaxID=2282849 RepID=UPI001EF810FF|nr:sensor histidine kinase [Paenibacillus sp. H1-7]ULL19384.1 sensor histidine kinase [Paenibacillus sp. H1-7]